MRKALYLFGLAMAVCTAGCEKDSVRRLTYGTLQGLQRQTCLENNPTQAQDCLRAESYDQFRYQRQATDVERR